MTTQFQDHVNSLLKLNADKMSVSLVMLFLKVTFIVMKIHNHKLIAFDLKDDNLMMRNPYNPVMIDLGTVQTSQEANLYRIQLGSPAYLGQ